MFFWRDLLKNLTLKGARKKTAPPLGLIAQALLSIVLVSSFAYPFQTPPRQANPGVKAGLSLSQPLVVRWRYSSDAVLNLTPAIDRDRIYMPLAGGTIVSLRADDGQLHWKSEIGGEFTASPAADSHAVYVASESLPAAPSGQAGKGAIRALGLEGGLTIWMRTMNSSVRGALAVNNNKVVGGTADGSVFALDRATGNVLWVVEIGSAMNCQPVITGDAVYIGSEEGTLFSLDESSGRVRWRFKTAGPVRGPVAIANDSVYFGSGDGYAYAVSASEGRLHWRTRTGAGVQAVVAVTDGLLVASLDNFAYLLSLSRGKRIWKRQLPGRVSSQPLITADSALFTPLSSDAGVVLALRNGKQINSLPTGDSINTAASPVIAAGSVFLTTDRGLLAFSHPEETKPNRIRP
jgi:outer membrane protein assembly factor BamB